MGRKKFLIYFIGGMACGGLAQLIGERLEWPEWIRWVTLVSLATLWATTVSCYYLAKEIGEMTEKIKGENHGK